MQRYRLRNEYVLSEGEDINLKRCRRVMLEGSGNPIGKESWGSVCVHTHACTRAWVEGGRQGLAGSSVLAMRLDYM